MSCVILLYIISCYYTYRTNRSKKKTSNYVFNRLISDSAANLLTLSFISFFLSGMPFYNQFEVTLGASGNTITELRTVPRGSVVYSADTPGLLNCDVSVTIWIEWLEGRLDVSGIIFREECCVWEVCIHKLFLIDYYAHVWCFVASYKMLCLTKFWKYIMLSQFLHIFCVPDKIL